MPSYLIIGAGVFGVSTAYHLLRNDPALSVTLVDRDSFDAKSRVAASWDWNKVIRTDYSDPTYCRLSIEAQDIFMSDPLWKPYFHKTGIYWICRSNYAQKVVENYRTLGRRADVSLVSVDEARKMYKGVFENADFNGVKEVLVNETSGWAAAADCLEAITRETVRLGAKYVTAEVSSLQFDSHGCCNGAKTATGDVLSASHVLICTGAYTPKLLESSAQSSGILDLRAGSRIVAGGVTTGMVQLESETYNTYAAMPVALQGYTPEIGPNIGSLPPTKEKQLKWWGQTIFRNTTEVLPGRHFSAPPSERDYDQWNISQRLKEDISYATKVFYGEPSAHWNHEKYRICWDAFTPGSDFIISPHPASKGLYVATCGSFHGWKFFPIIGKYIVQMLDGSLSAGLSRRWAWDRERPDPSQDEHWPKTELRDLV